jgi:cell fate (sporulation/competence/biofilm development) regulator YlbF (YheA/YmcA/DUF963 family)
MIRIFNELKDDIQNQLNESQYNRVKKFEKTQKQVNEQENVSKLQNKTKEIIKI